MANNELVSPHDVVAGLPINGVDPIGVVVTVCASWVEQFPPGEDTIESI
jgi:hypothetical protein